MARTAADVMQMLKDNEVKFVDLRFADTRGKALRMLVQALRDRTVSKRIPRIAAARKPQAQTLHRPAAHPQPVHQQYGWAQRFFHNCRHIQARRALKSMRKPANAGSRQNAK